MKNTYFIVISTFLFASTAHSQSVLLAKDQSSFFVEAGVAGGEGLTSYGFGLGATYMGTFDVGVAISRVTDGIGSAWGLGEALQVNIVRKRLSSSTIFFSLEQTFTILENVRSLSLGGSFSHKITFSSESAFVYSVGCNWLKPLNSDEKSLIVFPLQIALSFGERRSRFYIAPSVILASDNSVVYGVAFGLSSIQPRGDW